MALVTTLDPTIPFNDGLRRPIGFTNPEGKITNPKWPAPVNSYYGLSNVLYSTVNRALARFFPQRAVASPGLGSAPSRSATTRTARGARRCSTSCSPPRKAGGRTTTAPRARSGSSTSPPIRRSRSSRPSSRCGCGASNGSRIPRAPGPFRGGLGNRKEYELLGDATVTLRLGHQFDYGGWGVFGGKEPARVKAFLNPRTNHERALRPLETIRMTPGERFLVEMPGGGGYGNPHERPAEPGARGRAQRLCLGRGGGARLRRRHRQGDDDGQREEDGAAEEVGDRWPRAARRRRAANCPNPLLTRPRLIGAPSTSEHARLRHLGNAG